MDLARDSRLSFWLMGLELRLFDSIFIICSKNNSHFLDKKIAACNVVSKYLIRVRSLTVLYNFLSL